MLRPVILLLQVSLPLFNLSGYGAVPGDPAPSYYRDQPACKVKSVREEPTTYESPVKSPVSGLVALSQQDSKGIYQVYIKREGADDLKCISCAAASGFPRVDRNKPMISWHPSGEWLIVGVEEAEHEFMALPSAIKRGLLQSGVWLNLWITTPTGERWYQITDFKKPEKGPNNGYVGTAFTRDGKQAVWAEIVGGNLFVDHFGVWKLYMADFSVSADGVPSMLNKREITPEGARWVEPGTFAPDGRHILISSDIGIADAQGQDQFILDTATRRVQNLTNSPTVWDEHGVFSHDGSKISFMSSYPYRSESGSNKLTSLKTEFMLMDSDGTHLQQITHFNVPSYPESQAKKTVAAVAGFTDDGSQLFATVMSNKNAFTKTNWIVTFEGRCGNARRPKPR